MRRRLAGRHVAGHRAFGVSTELRCPREAVRASGGPVLAHAQVSRRRGPRDESRITLRRIFLLAGEVKKLGTSQKASLTTTRRVAMLHSTDVDIITSTK